MKLAIITLLLLAACSPAVELTEPETAVVAPEVSNEELEGIDDIDAILAGFD